MAIICILATVTMQEPTYLILSSLAGPPLHGYGIISEVKTLSAARVTLSAGTLYAALERLTLEGLIAVDREESVNGRTRRYYQLTPAGGNALRAEATHLRRNAETAQARLSRWSPTPQPNPS